MATDWRRHFYEQVINQGKYDPVDETVLEELFFGLNYLLHDVDESGRLVNDEEGIKAYTFVIKDYLTPEHIKFFNKLLEDIDKERYGEKL